MYNNNFFLKKSFNNVPVVIVVLEAKFPNAAFTRPQFGSVQFDDDAFCILCECVFNSVCVFFYKFLCFLCVKMPPLLYIFPFVSSIIIIVCASWASLSGRSQADRYCFSSSLWLNARVYVYTFNTGL